MNTLSVDVWCLISDFSEGGDTVTLSYLNSTFRKALRHRWMHVRMVPELQTTLLDPRWNRAMTCVRRICLVENGSWDTNSPQSRTTHTNTLIGLSKTAPLRHFNSPPESTGRHFMGHEQYAVGPSVRRSWDEVRAVHGSHNCGPNTPVATRCTNF
jgi:hypothetical protein